DGQVQVIGDVLGLNPDFNPKHAKPYAQLYDVMSTAVTQYRDEVQSGRFPTERQGFTMDESVISQLEDESS
ncbi:MAG: 3-methyl-2-oxobutanoate hydroxymethyltransferase, partial [Dehalococcoidales bacterium]